MAEPIPRLFVALIGDINHEPAAQVKYGHFIRALGRRFPLVVCDATLRGLPRLLNALQAFSPNRAVWKQRFYQNVAAFQLRSNKIARALRGQPQKVDLSLQIGALFDAASPGLGMPNIIYTDYTSRLSSRKPSAGRGPEQGAQQEQWIALEQQAFQRASHICARAAFVCQSITAEYHIPPARVSVIGGGLNFDRLPETKPRTAQHAPTALFIGKDFYRKGGDLLLTAFQAVRQVVPEARLLMVTDGPIPAGVDLSGVQVIPPTWDRSAIQALYEQADCFVLPSRLETWGDVLLEAMAYELPCIGVSGEAMGDIIADGQTGFVIPPEDSPALAQALIRLLSDQALRLKFGAASRRRVEMSFTWDRVVERLVPIIVSTVQSSNVMNMEERSKSVATR